MGEEAGVFMNPTPYTLHQNTIYEPNTENLPYFIVAQVVLVECNREFLSLGRRFSILSVLNTLFPHPVIHQDTCLTPVNRAISILIL
jgi:hypothetical protein